MRRDIGKVIYERAKAGRTWASKTPRRKDVRLDTDGEQFDESLNCIRRRRQKHRNEHFSPLGRFLVRGVGRCWKDVFAEICSVTDQRSLLGAEIRDRVQDLVAQRCWLENGKVMTADSSLGPCEVHGLYVHPRSGLLMRTPGHSRIT